MNSKRATQTSLHTLLPVGSKARSKLESRLQPRTTHGGDLARGKRKTERPWTRGAPVHVVLKSLRARGGWSMLHRKHRSKITSMIYVYARRFKVEVYRATNAGNHLHLLVKAKDRKNLADYLRVLAGRVACTVSGARKGVKKIGKFWDSLCWSRLVNWGRDFFQVRDYLIRNLDPTYLPTAPGTLIGSTVDLASHGDLWGDAALTRDKPPHDHRTAGI
ncbi:MAG: transposase [Bdellovibrionales bacterium]|nr:transposase [Bdellovibrionales bacterium]